MDSAVFTQWQQWEGRVTDWLGQPDDELLLVDMDRVDRQILTLLAVKHRVIYEDLGTDGCSGDSPSTIRLSKTKSPDEEPAHKGREKLFSDFTGRTLTPEQAANETSPEWIELNQLCNWHGTGFIERAKQILQHIIADVLSSTSPYQALLHQPIPPAMGEKIMNRVYTVKNDGGLFISIDMKSANFSILQHMGVIDRRVYPTWSDLVSVFVGPRPLLTRSKKLRQRALGRLPGYDKLEKHWTRYTIDIYTTLLRPSLDERQIDGTCVSLCGDEIVFRLDRFLQREEVLEVVAFTQRCLDEQSPTIKFAVQAYRLQMFNWRNGPRCFARLFITSDENENEKKFDLKCVPQKEQNYEQAYEDFREFAGL